MPWATAKAAEIADAAKFPADVRDGVIEVLQTLWGVLIKEDATLVEVNPLIVTRAGKLVALDAKIGIDPNAVYRHPELAALRDEAADLAEALADWIGEGCLPLRVSTTLMPATSLPGVAPCQLQNTTQMASGSSQLMMMVPGF